MADPPSPGASAESAERARISRALGPLRDVVASLAAAGTGNITSASERRKLLRRVRAAGPSALPALLRSLSSHRTDEAQWAAWLLERVAPAHRAQVVERLSRLLEEPRLSPEPRARAESLLRRLVGAAHPPEDEADDEGEAGDHPLLGEELRLVRALDQPVPEAPQRREVPARRAIHCRDLCRLGVDLLERGELSRAHAALARAVAADPDDCEALSYLGICLLQLSQPEAALAHLERACDLEPGEALNHWNVAAAARGCERLFRAYLALERYLELPDRYAGHPARRREAHRFVLDQRQQVASLHPGLPLEEVLRAEHLFTRSLRQLTARRFAEAAAGFRGVLALLPRHHPSWGNLGAAELGLGNHDEAAHCLRRALAIKPDYEVARDNLRLIETRH